MNTDVKTFVRNGIRKLQVLVNSTDSLFLLCFWGILMVQAIGLGARETQAQDRPENSYSVLRKVGYGRLIGTTFSGDGKHVITGSMGDYVRFWNRKTGEKEREFYGVPSPDGRLLMKGNKLTNVMAKPVDWKLWSVPEGKWIRSETNRKTPGIPISYRPKQQLIAWNTSEHVVEVQTVQGDVIQTFQQESKTVIRGSLSPDGETMVIVGGKDQIQFYSVSSGERVKTVRGHSGRVTTVRYTPDGRYLISGGRGGKIHVWSTENYSTVATFQGNGGAVIALDIHPDGDRLVSVSTDGQLRIWSISRQRQLRSISVSTLDSSLNHYAPAVKYSSDGESLSVATAEGAVRVFSAENGKQKQVVRGFPDRVRTFAVSPGETQLATGGKDGRVYLWNLETGVLDRELNVGGGTIEDVSYSSGGNLLAVVGKRRLNVFDLAENERLINRFTGTSNSTVAFAGKGQFVVVFRSGSGFVVLDVPSGQEKRAVSIDRSRAMAVSSESDQVAVSRGSGRVEIYRISDGTHIKDLSVSSPWAEGIKLSELVFSSRGDTVFGAGSIPENQSSVGVIQWNVGSGAEVQSYKYRSERAAHHPLRSLTVSMKEQKLAIGLSSILRGKVVVWSIPDGKIHTTLSTPGLDHRFFSDSDRLAIGSIYGYVTIYGSR